MIALWFSPQVTLGSLIIAIGVSGAFITLSLSIFRYSRAGGATVELLESQCVALERETRTLKEEKIALLQRNDDLTDAAHQAELAVKDREKELERFKTMPDTERMLAVFEMHSTATVKAFGELNTTLTPIAQGVSDLVSREHAGRSSDSK